MRARVRLAANSPFLRSAALLSGGSFSGIALPILAAPILGRLYRPEDYGALVQYMAFAAILAVVSTLQFQHAIISEKTTRRANQIIWLCLVCSFISAIIVLLIILLLWPFGLSETPSGMWLWFLPASIALSGVVVSGAFLANRLGSYGWMGAMPVVQILATIILSIWLGILEWGAAGLLTAYIAGQVLQTAAYGSYLINKDVTHTRPSWKLLSLLAKRNYKFPRYTLPSSFISQLNMQLPIFALTAIGANAMLGNFARARQLASLPVTSIGGAVAQVFRRDGAELFRKTGNCRPLMLKTALGLFSAGIVPCLMFIWIAPWLFTFYLGPDWREAGDIARILAPMLLLRLITSPLTTVLYFTDNQRIDLHLMLFSGLVIAISVASAWFIHGTPRSVVIGFSIAYGFVYSIYFVICFRLARK